MITTVTFNPSLDYYVTVDHFRPGATNRTTSELLLPGGKGVNVSTVLSRLDVPNRAVFFSAGFVGEEITRRLSEEGIETVPIRVEKGNSRLNMKLRSHTGPAVGSAVIKSDEKNKGINESGVLSETAEDTEINGMGPDIPKEKIEELMLLLEKLENGDTLVLGGTIPGTLPATIYRDILERVSERKLRVVVDATKSLLLDTLDCHPFLIKPNHHELGELFGFEPDPKTVEGRGEIIHYMMELQQKGAKNVLCSMGADGALLLTDGWDILVAPAFRGKVISAVGSGDSMVAGFLAGLEEKNDLEYALLMGSAAGSASAFSEGLASGAAIRKLAGV